MDGVSCGAASPESNHLARSHNEGEQERGRREEDSMRGEYQCTRPDKGKMKEERLRQRPRLAVSPRLLAPRPQRSQSKEALERPWTSVAVRSLSFDTSSKLEK
ncbi:uncharacterized [Tachysurus ichikawai]